MVFPGYEWSGNTATGGDHNVIYLKDDPPIFRSSHWQIPQVPEDEFSPALLRHHRHPHGAVVYTVNDLPMGTFIETTDPLQVSARVIGTAPLEALHLYKGKEILQTIRPEAFETIEHSPRIRITWDGAITIAENRIASAKTHAFDSPADGHMAWCSPVYVKAVGSPR